MVMKTDDQDLWIHREWLGLLQPVGLVVSPRALQEAQVVFDRKSVDLQQRLLGLLQDGGEDDRPFLSSFSLYATAILGWLPEDLLGDAQENASGEGSPCDGYEVNLPNYGEVLRPSFVVPDPDGDRPLLLVKELPLGTDLDAIEEDKHWHVSPQARFERLLRENKIATGLLFNGRDLRLVYAPLGESSGYLTFPLEAMVAVPGRPILGAMKMLLGVDRVFEAPEGRRLTDILAASRKHQAEVSTELSKQVVDALWTLMNGFQIADATAQGAILGDLLDRQPQHIYGGLITTLLRLVFLLYAEDEGLMPGDDLYIQNYSVTGLFERLQEDEGKYPDTMDQRFGAWPWLLSLFRLVYDGGGAIAHYLPARHGALFNPQTYPFLEGHFSANGTAGGRDLPKIPDGVIYRVLQKLLILNGDRLSYRALDVEEIGSVYEAIMGFEIERTRGRSIGVWSKPGNSKVTVTVVVDLEALLSVPGKDRPKWIRDRAGCELSGKAETALKKATTIEDLLAALEKRISRHTPHPLPPGAMYLQPGEERRRTGSHYTPRTMTEMVVRDALGPVFSQMGDRPTPEQILALKVCDPAMGSGAFLVQVCRQLAEALVAAWEMHDRLGEVPPEDEPLLYARRLVAQNCLYGVDRNPFAVSLAKLSLWLVTLAKNHSFMFLDHALKQGDSLVGLTRSEIRTFTTQGDLQSAPLLELLQDKMEEAIALRQNINRDENYEQAQRVFQQSESVLKSPKVAGRLAVAAMFAETTEKKRKEKIKELANAYHLWQGSTYTDDQLENLYQTSIDRQKPLSVFPWELEFPEVFNQTNPGFDVIVGNPPFAGKNTLINGNPENYVEYLKELHPESHGNADVVAHFFRRSFNLLRQGGAMGLIATNTIAQGDTRQSGLRFICNHGGIIYHARRRYKWPGLAAVVVSVVHIFKVKS